MKNLLQNNKPPAPEAGVSELEKLRERAVDLASEDPFVTSGSLFDAFKRLAEAELVLHEKEVHGEFLRVTELEQELNDLLSRPPQEPSKSQGSVRAGVLPTRWQALRWLFGLGEPFGESKTRGQALRPRTTDARAWSDLVHECRQKIATARLREAEHEIYVSERLAVLTAEFDIQKYRASAAVHVAASAAVPPSAPQETQESNAAERKANETRSSFVQ